MVHVGIFAHSSNEEVPVCFMEGGVLGRNDSEHRIILSEAQETAFSARTWLKRQALRQQLPPPTVSPQPRVATSPTFPISFTGSLSFFSFLASFLAVSPNQNSS